MTKTSHEIANEIIKAYTDEETAALRDQRNGLVKGHDVAAITTQRVYHRLYIEIVKAIDAERAEAAKAKTAMRTELPAHNKAGPKPKFNFTKEQLLKAWEEHRWVAAHTAKKLGMHEATFREMLRKHGLKRPWEEAPPSVTVTDEKTDEQTPPSDL